MPVYPGAQGSRGCFLCHAALGSSLEAAFVRLFLCCILSTTIFLTAYPRLIRFADPGAPTRGLGLAHTLLRLYLRFPLTLAITYIIYGLYMAAAPNLDATFSALADPTR